MKTTKKPEKSGFLSEMSNGVGRLKSMIWCPEEDSNLHDVTRVDLNHVRLPIPPSGHSGSALLDGLLARCQPLQMKGQKVITLCPKS